MLFGRHKTKMVAQEDALPPAQCQAAVGDRQADGRTDQAGQDVGARVAFEVFEAALVGSLPLLAEGDERRREGTEPPRA